MDLDGINETWEEFDIFWMIKIPLTKYSLKGRVAWIIFFLMMLLRLINPCA